MQTYRVPLEPENGEVICSVIVVPASYHPLVGSGEPYEEVTASEYSCTHIAVTLTASFMGSEVEMSAMLEFAESACVHLPHSYFSPEVTSGGLAVIGKGVLALHQYSPAGGVVVPKFVSMSSRHSDSYSALSVTVPFTRRLLGFDVSASFH